MDATTARPTLLSAARNFIRKSAGTAILAIAPLATVSVAQAQTTFTAPDLNTHSSGDVTVTGTNFSGGLFAASGGTGANNIAGRRVGTSGYFYTESGSGTNAYVSFTLMNGISGSAISPGTVIPLAYDFTLTKQAGAIGNVNWVLDVSIAGDTTYSVASGMLTSSTATFTGTGNYTTVGTIPGDLSMDLRFFLILAYTTAFQQEVAVSMNSGNQGFTINAAIPEPSTYAALLGLGALGFLIVRRARRLRAA